MNPQRAKVLLGLRVTEVRWYLTFDEWFDDLAPDRVQKMRDVRKYYRKNKDVVSEKQRQFRRLNRERLAAQQRVHRAKNRKLFRQRDRERYHQKKQELAARRAQWEAQYGKGGLRRVS